MGTVIPAVWERLILLLRGAWDGNPVRPAFMLLCLVTIITYYLGYCKQKSDNFNQFRCGEKSPWRRFCALRAVGSLVSMVQIRSYVHPLCDV